MGNHALCGESSKLQCSTEQCAQTVPCQRFDADCDANCDPVGAVFTDTLEELRDVDKQLLLFSSSACLVAVRWLLKLGANHRIRDSNATSCLHAACRSGAPAIVGVLLSLERSERCKGAEEEGLLAAIDVAGWTPLHVAVFMGRPDVVSMLLEEGASPLAHTLTGRTILDLCSDLRTHEVIMASCHTLLLMHGGEGPSESDFVPDSKCPDGLVGDPVQDQFDLQKTTSGEVATFEPLFVLRNPVIATGHHQGRFAATYLEIARDIFNCQPGCGLSFLVASGCVRDYPMNLVHFLRSGGICSMQIGTFLGEDFSLSKILRMEFINSIEHYNSGVVTSLKKIFSCCGVPQSLQKMDRIVASLAEVWWRQHSRGVTEKNEVDVVSVHISKSLQEPEWGLRGKDLKKHLASPNSLHQLMFSSMMLHWNMHAPFPQADRMSMGQWTEMNQGIGPGGTDLPAKVLAPIFHELSGSAIPQLDLGSVPLPRAGSAEFMDGSALAAHAQIEGWAEVAGAGLPRPAMGEEVNGVTPNGCTQLSYVLSEATATPRSHIREGSGISGFSLPSPRSSQIQKDGHTHISPSLSIGEMMKSDDLCGEHDFVWLSLCGPLLFLSAGPWNPFAFVPLSTMQVFSVEFAQGLLCVAGQREGATLQLVFLLPDGRWRRYRVQSLAIQLSDHQQLDDWIAKLDFACNSL